MRRRHAPDPADRRQVEVMAGFGMPEAGIASMVGVEFKANTKVAESLRPNPSQALFRRA